MLVTVPANKLEDVDVDYISLVARGANRVPFRIIKQEKGMINLSNLKTLLRKKDMLAKAELYGIVLPKELADNERVMAAVAKTGAKVDKREEKDGAVILKQIDGEAGDKAVVLKLSDQVAVVMKAFQGLAGIGGTDFNEILKTQGFFPGFSMATDALFMTIRNVMLDEDVRSTDQAVTKVDTALDQYHQYVVGILADVPTTAFKVEKAVEDEIAAIAKEEADAKAKGDTEAEKKAKTEAEAKAKAEVEAKAKAEAEAKAKAGGTNPDGTCMEGYVKVNGVCVLKKDKEDAEAKDDLLKQIGASMQAVLGEALTGVNAAMAEINKTVTGLNAKVDSITKAQEELKGQVTKAAETAKKAEDTLKGLTIGGLPNGDPDHKVTERKGEMGNIDTAFNPTVRKKASAYGTLIAERTRGSK